MRDLVLKKNRHLPTIRIFGKSVPLPKMRSRRVVLGVALVCGGILGWLPILGFWMLPLGLFILSYDSPRIRRMRRRIEVRLMRHAWCQSSRKLNKLNRSQKKTAQ